MNIENHEYLYTRWNIVSSRISEIEKRYICILTMLEMFLKYSECPVYAVPQDHRIKAQLVTVNKMK